MGAGVLLTAPVAECRYYHRSLNPKKLIDVGFSHLGRRMTMARTIKLYKLPDEPQVPGLRAMEAKDVPRVTQLLATYLEKFALAPVFTEADVAHILLPREGVVFTSVIATDSGEVTDVGSFYSLPSSIIDNEKYSHLHAAYSYY